MSLAIVSAPLTAPSCLALWSASGAALGDDEDALLGSQRDGGSQLQGDLARSQLEGEAAPSPVRPHR